MADYISDLRAMVGNARVIVNGACVMVFDGEGRLLLQQRRDNGLWGLPGGLMELGEKIEDTARREVWEETGLRLGKLEFFGVYSGKERFVDLPNGHQLAMVRFAFTCREYSGTLQAQPDESLAVGWFALDDLPENLFPNQQEVIDDLLSGKPTPILD
ncbi:NUDIX hydrolase [Tumebacillus flagellatus]|uniref:Nudix hydrolase domain-containing protein n=1 Tax=Tumebacillus flagellatus TaxID=1157490 RepID=A0A074M9W0_9BACL|nr:NUDIX hydrolase [Tumebacillus flagellatus]KEO82747.1 hypothetical protein EL26_13435 [Tumebacillus flagellatus]